MNCAICHRLKLLTTTLCSFNITHLSSVSHSASKNYFTFANVCHAFVCFTKRSASAQPTQNYPVHLLNILPFLPKILSRLCEQARLTIIDKAHAMRANSAQMLSFHPSCLTSYVVFPAIKKNLPH